MDGTNGSQPPSPNGSSADDQHPLPTRRSAYGGTGSYPTYSPLPFDSGPAEPVVRESSPFDPPPMYPARIERDSRPDYAFDAPSFQLRRAPAEHHDTGDERY